MFGAAGDDRHAHVDVRELAGVAGGGVVGEHDQVGAVADLEPSEPVVGSDSDGSNAVQHEPDPQAEHKERVNPDGKRPRGPYPTGNV